MLAREKENRWKCWLEKKKRSGKYMNNTVKNTYLHAAEGSSGQQKICYRTARQNWFLDILVTNEKSVQFAGGEKAV